MRRIIFFAVIIFILNPNLQGNVWSQPKGDTHTKETPKDRTIRGKVLDDNLEPIIDVIIKINDSVKVGKTGVDGTFEITTSIPIYKLYFESIGWEDAKISLSNDCNNIELIISLCTPTVSYHWTKSTSAEKRNSINSQSFINKRINKACFCLLNLATYESS